ncbi:MBL fold metallo-hydrolase [Pseudoruegeria sp. HB172150]|uniref:MBL fold metallo-hydrolase n=1 Tax=Pseudoruegeria sp. HB172150 TaxID=2721164 RepID=UPI001552046C|nr:MBL fold metallo-hydrolase [Pseudoruegeria sp. HB172150]
MDRRGFLTSLMAGPAALSALSRKVVAQVQSGSGTLTTVSDGHLVLPVSFVLAPLSDSERAAVLSRYRLNEVQLESPCNLTLFRDGERTVLFDAGAGSDFMTTAGALLEDLDAAGVAPEDITHIIFTHAHPDHLWGVIDEFEDFTFPNAEYRIGRVEWDYWMREETVDEISTDRQAFAVGARRRLEMLEDNIEFFDDGAEVLPGISAVATYGHTPGHMSFEVGGSDSVFVIGDAIANPHVSFGWPSWRIGSDQDSDMGAATRMALIKRLTAEKAKVVGFHLPGGGIGQIVADGVGYRFVTAEQ